MGWPVFPVSGFVRFCQVLSGCVAVRWRRPAGARVVAGSRRNGSGGERHWMRLSKNGAGVWTVAQGCGVRLGAETQFARRLIIGFGGAETNHGCGDWGGMAR
jgi:hypothetical protein